METGNDNRKSTEKQNKMTMADRFTTAMFLPKSYDKILKEHTGKLVQFLVLLIFLLSVIRYVIPTLAAVAGMGGVKNIILNEIPEFSLKNGEFYLADTIETNDEINGIYIIVDTEVDKYTSEDVPANVVEAIMVSKNNILLYNDVTGFNGMVQEYAFKDFKDFTLTNELVAEKSPIFYIAFVFTFIMMYFFEMAKYLFVSLFYSVMFVLFIRMTTLQLSFGDVYKTSIYAQTIGAIISAIAYCVNSSLLIMASSIFAVFVTVSIMNKVCVFGRQQSMMR